MVHPRLLAQFWRIWQQQWLAPQRMAEQRLRLLRALITHAYERVPYYRERWRSLGICPSDLTTETDLVKFPCLTKAELQSRPLQEFLAEGTDLNRTVSFRTSGSSGRPLTIHLSHSENRIANMIATRSFIAAGSRPWRRRVKLTAVDRMPQPGGRLRNRLRLHLPSGRDPRDYLQVLLDYRPAEVHGYSQSLRQLAQLLIDQGIDGLRPRFVLGTAEMLTPRDRKLINAAFGVDMVDHYGSVEARAMAWECPHHAGYHLNSDVTVFEFIKEGQAAALGESASIVVTPLYQSSMPLIRYEMGDFAARSARSCPCGRTLPLMEQLEGRRDDCLALASGRLILPVGSFANVIEAESDVLEYFVTQEAIDRIVVQLVIRPPHHRSLLAKVQRGIRELVHDEAAVQVVSVEAIQRDGHSKLRRIASKVRSTRDPV